MNDLVLSSSTNPALITVAGVRARTRVLEFFAAKATREFLAWCERGGVMSIADQFTAAAAAATNTAAIDLLAKQGYPPGG